MKVQYAILPFCVIFLSGVEAHNAEFLKVIDKCVETTGTDINIVNKLFTDKTATTEDPKVQCVFKCILEEIKWMDSNGNIVEGPAMGLQEREIKFAKLCKDFSFGTDPCEKAYNFHKCFVAMKHNVGEDEE